MCTAGISFWIFYCFTHSQLQKASSEEVVTEESYGTFHWWAGCSWEEGMSVVVSAEDCRTVYVWELLWHVGFFIGLRNLWLLITTNPFHISHSIMRCCWSHLSSSDGHPSSLNMSVTLDQFLQWLMFYNIFISTLINIYNTLYYLIWYTVIKWRK